MKNIFAILGSLMLFAAPAHAGLLLEPYLGYETSSVSATFTVSGVGVPVDSKNKGTTAIGGRIGYKLLIPVWFAADVSTSSGTYKADTPLGTDSTFKRMSTYATVGFDFPILFRAWLGIGVGNKTTITSAGTDTDMKGGSSQKLGLGLTFLPMVSVNVEAFTNKPDLPTGYTKAEESGVQLGVSLPFNL